MGTANTIRVSTEAFDEIQTQLKQVYAQLESQCNTVSRIASRISEEAGSDIRVPVSIRLSLNASIGTGDVKSVLNRCNKALKACAGRTNTLNSAVAKASMAFTDNERKLVERFGNTSNGNASTLQGGSSSGNSASVSGAEEGGIIAQLRENMPWLADLLQNLLSLGDDGETIFSAIMAAIRFIGGNTLSAQAIACSNMSLSQLLSSSAGQAFLKDMSGLAIASFVMKIGSGVINDINAGLTAERVLTNVLANTLIGTLSIVGGAVAGDTLATGLMGAIALIPGIQPALPFISVVVYPICNIAMTKTVDWVLNLEIGEKPITDHIKDAFYDAYCGIKEGAQYLGEAMNTINDMIQSGAEFVQETVSEGIDFVQSTVSEGVDFVQETVSEGIDFVQSAVSEGVDFVQETVSEGIDFVQSAVSEGVDFVQNTVSNTIDGAQDFLDSLFSAPSVSWLGV